MAILYKCSWRGCSKVLDNKGYCIMHKNKADKILKDNNNARHTAYSINRLLDKEQKKYQTFYSSKQWIDKREHEISGCYAIDIVELYRTGRVIQGYTMHHIDPLDTNYQDRLDSNNLIYLTQSNHIRIHKEYKKSGKDRRIMQELLLDLKVRFNEEYEL